GCRGCRASRAGARPRSGTSSATSSAPPPPSATTSSTASARPRSSTPRSPRSSTSCSRRTRSRCGARRPTSTRAPTCTSPARWRSRRCASPVSARPGSTTSPTATPARAAAPSPRTSGATEMQTQIDVASVDLFDMRWWSDGPPHALFADLRRERPIHRNPLPDGSSCWALLRHADIAAASRDPGTFSSARGGIFLNPDQMLPLEVLGNLLLYMDPPQHTRFKQILQRVFTPRATATLEPNIRARVTRTIDKFVEDGECDLVDDLAVPVPLGVLTELMGVLEVDIHHFHTWTQELEVTTRDPEPNTAGPA